MPYMKFRISETPNGRIALARVYAGPSDDDNCYSGTLAMPPEMLDQFLDCLVLGASYMQFEGDRLRVFFGPDDGGG
jgi:hypothetical protein